MIRLDRAELARSRMDDARARLERCDLCPRLCGVDRLAGETGECGTSAGLVVSAISLHRGEEPAIGGTRGSCNVFMTGCNLHCVCCQNHPISHLGVGRECSADQVTRRVMSVLRSGTGVLNIVTGTHQIPALLEPLAAILEREPSLTVVWNSSGYERVETLRLLEGLVDVYLPDYKFEDPTVAASIAHAPDYPRAARDALLEMARQVGPLALDPEGNATSGLIVRHLVLPGDLAGTARVLDFVATRLPGGTAVSLMGQFVPAGLAIDHPLLGRRLTREEYERACELLLELDIETGWIQDMDWPEDAREIPDPHI